MQDLIEIIVSWGCATGSCDCSGDVNGDCVVNVEDLVLVITSWGPCS